MIIPAIYEDLHTHHVGTTPNRCYFIPASCRRLSICTAVTTVNGPTMETSVLTVWFIPTERLVPA